MSRISLPSLFQSHMTLQRGKSIQICGSVQKASTVRIVFGAETFTAPVASSRFCCTLPPRDAAWNETLSFYLDDADRPDLVFTDINIGDIWMAMGQSNMEFGLRYDAEWNQVQRWPRNPNVRMYNVPRIAFEGQRRDMSDFAHWFDEGDEAWANFSAPGYSFARTIQPDLGIPVGIIGCNWGGTPASAWIEESYLTEEPLCHLKDEYEASMAAHTVEELEKASKAHWQFQDSVRQQFETRVPMYGFTPTEQRLWMAEHADDPQLPLGPWHHYRPSGLYHTMVEEVAPFPVKGIIWYQGESDQSHADLYDQTMAALIHCLRKTWHDEALPFLFVQLAPFREFLDCTANNYAILREKQELVSCTMPNTWMASIMDIGDLNDIHPKFKMEVGRRLGLLARGHVYGLPGLCDAPELKQAVRDMSDYHLLRLTFANAGDGLHIGDRCAESFRIIQHGRRLQVSECWISRDTLILKLLGISEQIPLEINFACEDDSQVYIWNSVGLSARPFRCKVS